MLIALDNIESGVSHHRNLASHHGLLELTSRFHNYLEVKTADGVIVSSVVERSGSLARNIYMFGQDGVDLLDSRSTVCQVVPNSLIVSPILARPYPVELREGGAHSVLELEGKEIRLPVLEILQVNPAGGVLRDSTGPVNGVVHSWSVVIDNIPNDFPNLNDD